MDRKLSGTLTKETQRREASGNYCLIIPGTHMSSSQSSISIALDAMAGKPSCAEVQLVIGSGNKWSARNLLWSMERQRL